MITLDLLFQKIEGKKNVEFCFLQLKFQRGDLFEFQIEHEIQCMHSKLTYKILKIEGSDLLK